jgi:hypothetical protein
MHLLQFREDRVGFRYFFFRLALADFAQAVAQGVELRGDGLQAGQLLVGVALAGDELAADLRSGQPAIQAGGAKGGMGGVSPVRPNQGNSRLLREIMVGKSLFLFPCKGVILFDLPAARVFGVR